MRHKSPTMGFYKKIILPRICDLAMRNNRLVPYRERVIGAAEGRVLEIGAGSGLNIRLYKSSASEVLALEPDPKLIAMAERNTKNAARHSRNRTRKRGFTMESAEFTEIFIFKVSFSESSASRR